MKENVPGRNYGKWIQTIGAVILLVCAGATLHDMQTAEGAGLYLSLQAGAQDRRMYDLLVDAAGMACLLAVLLFPCLLCRRFRIDAFFRFACACFAFLPVVSMGKLVHLVDGTEEILCRQAILEGRVWEACLEGLDGILPVLAVGIPLLILGTAAVKTEGAKSGEGGIWPLAGPWRRIWHGILAVQFLLFTGAVLFPALTESFAYLIVSILLLYGFFLWEELYERNPKWKPWSWILFGIFWLRGIERMLELMSVYHL